MKQVAVEEIDGSFVPRRSSVASVEVDGETVLAGGQARAFYRLDPMASLIWSCLDGSGSALEIAADLAAEFGAPPSTVAGDVVALTRTLGRLCFLEGVRCLEDDPAPWTAPGPAPAGGAPEGRRRLVEPPSG